VIDEDDCGAIGGMKSQQIRLPILTPSIVTPRDNILSEYELFLYFGYINKMKMDKQYKSFFLTN
jgi:hypothetical protein